MEDLYYRKPRQHRFLGRLKKKRIVLTLLVGGLAMGYVLLGSHGIVQRVRLEAEREEMKKKIDAAQMENKRLSEESQALNSDLKAIEKVAREKYGMIRRGETMYRLKKKE
jgi:cell division protein FtsB